MNRQYRITALVCTACLLALAPAAGPAGAGAGTEAAAPSEAAAAGITARVVSISETRERAVPAEGAAPAPPVSFFTGLRVKLRLEGPAAAGAAKIGRLKLTEATDDAGTDLRDKDQLRWGEQLQDVGRFGQSEQDKARGAFEYELKLGLPARKASSLKSVKGRLEVLAGGEEKLVSVPKVRTLAGKSVDHPALKAARVSLKIVASPANQKNAVQAEIAGDLDAIKEVKILSADGTNLLAGSWWSDAAGKRSVTYMLSQPADDDAVRLEMKLSVGQKKLTVPVELANLPLP